MITDNQAIEAIKTIAEYCDQFKDNECNDGTCILSKLCTFKMGKADPAYWPEYLEGENE